MSQCNHLVSCSECYQVVKELQTQVAELLETAVYVNKERMKDEATIAELEAENERLEKENNTLREIIQPRTEQVIEWAAKYAQMRELYNDLIYQVANVHPNESRHETAKRYIMEAEQPSNNQAECAALQEGEC